MTNRKAYLWLITLLAAALSGCRQERQVCLTPTAQLYLRTMHKTTDTATLFYDTVLPAAVLGAITDTGTPQLRLYAQSALFAITLSPRADSCKWLITTDSLRQPFDTLVFRYARNLQFVSNACGYAYNYVLSSVGTTTHNIDSVRITNANVTNNANTEKNLRVYFHPNY